MKKFTIKELAIRENSDITIDWKRTLYPLQKNIGVSFNTLHNLLSPLTRNNLNTQPKTRRHLVKYLQENNYKIYTK